MACLSPGTQRENLFFLSPVAFSTFTFLGGFCYFLFIFPYISFSFLFLFLLYLIHSCISTRVSWAAGGRHSEASLLQLALAVMVLIELSGAIEGPFS